MGIEVFLGSPPPHIEAWIKANYKPAGNPKTKITFNGGIVEEYDWSGKITNQMVKEAGQYNENNWTWTKKPQSVEIGTNVTSIGETAFADIESLASITIPNSVTNIGSRAFYHCTKLTSVTISDGVTEIQDDAFTSCESLTSMMIPNSVTSIKGYAFSSCFNLTSVTFSGKNIATVKGMSNYPWNLKVGCVIHCTDGDITL